MPDPRAMHESEEVGEEAGESLHPLIPRSRTPPNLHHPLTPLRWRGRAPSRQRQNRSAARVHVVAAGIYAYACVYVCIWLQVSGDGGEVVEKFIVQQFIWPRASMLIDLTVLAVRPNSKRLRETRPSHPAGGMRGPANGTPANGTPAHRRPEAPSCSQSCIYAVGGPLGPSAALRPRGRRLSSTRYIGRPGHPRPKLASRMHEGLMKARRPGLSVDR